MKMLYCNKCFDIVNLSHDYKECRCGKVAGYYTGYEDMIYSGDATTIGIDNRIFFKSVENVPLDGKGVDIHAYIIPYYCDSSTKVPNALSVYHKTKNHSMGDAYQKEWSKKITNIRIKNPFLKLLYVMFKKWIFISVKEDEVIVTEENEQDKYEEKIYLYSKKDVWMLKVWSFFYGYLSNSKKQDRASGEIAWEAARNYLIHEYSFTADIDKKVFLPLDKEKKV